MELDFNYMLIDQIETDLRRLIRADKDLVDSAQRIHVSKLITQTSFQTVRIASDVITAVNFGDHRILNCYQHCDCLAILHALSIEAVNYLQQLALCVNKLSQMGFGCWNDLYSEHNKTLKQCQ